MEVPQDIINKWQTVWKYITRMAYYRIDVVDNVSVTKHDYETLLKYSQSRCSNFDEITLDYEWTLVSRCKDETGTFRLPLVVPELREIYVPRILFETLGVYSWFKHSFPNCTILFWEDDM